MPSQPILRTTYIDPTNGLVRLGSTTHGESLIDQSRHLQGIEMAHGSGLHDWGIGEGLAISATLNQAGVRVLPGVALDASGRHICLVQSGKAEVGPNADGVGVAANLVDVLATGAVLPTTGLAGSYFVSITLRETFDADLWNSSSQTIFQMLHTPWLRLELAANVTNATDDGSRVILGRVEIGAGNLVAALTHERRRECGLPAGSLKFWRGETTGGPPNLKADNTLTAELRARAAGGLEVKVVGAADQVDFRRDGGNIAKVSFGADQIVGRRADGIESVVIDPVLGNIRLGTQGVEGDVVVNDAHNRRVIVLDGGDASVTIGANGNEGDIRVMDAVGQPSLRVDGATGKLFLKRVAPIQGTALDVDATYLRLHGTDLMLDGRSGGNKRALVDATNRLVVNYANDYANGVDINGLHLTNHVRIGEVEGFDVSRRPTYNQYITLQEFGIGLQSSEWIFSTTCEVGMFDDGVVSNFWWGVANNSFVNQNGEIVIKWVVNYHDRGDDWRPWRWHIGWVAFRR